MDTPKFKDATHIARKNCNEFYRRNQGPKISRWSAFLWKYHNNSALRDLVDSCIAIAFLCMCVVGVITVILCLIPKE